MKPGDKYRKFVDWSEEDNCYIGRCSELMLGGIHGDDRVQVYSDLCDIVEELLDLRNSDSTIWNFQFQKLISEIPNRPLVPEEVDELFNRLEEITTPEMEEESKRRAKLIMKRMIW